MAEGRFELGTFRTGRANATDTPRLTPFPIWDYLFENFQQTTSSKILQNAFSIIRITRRPRSGLTVSSPRAPNFENIDWFLNSVAKLIFNFAERRRSAYFEAILNYYSRSLFVSLIATPRPVFDLQIIVPRSNSKRKAKRSIFSCRSGAVVYPFVASCKCGAATFI